MILSSKSEFFRLATTILLVVAGAILTALPTPAQTSFSNGVLPNGVPSGATGSNVLEEAPLYYDPASGDYRPDEGASVQAGDRTASFQVESGMDLQRRFERTEETLDERTLERGMNETILSGASKTLTRCFASRVELSANSGYVTGN